MVEEEKRLSNGILYKCSHTTYPVSLELILLSQIGSHIHQAFGDQLAVWLDPISNQPVFAVPLREEFVVYRLLTVQ